MNSTDDPSLLISGSNSISAVPVAFNGEFAVKVRNAISQSIFGLIPDDQLLELVNKEIKAFFETEDYVVLTSIDNPKAPKNPSYYDKTPKTLDAFSFKMTPFRQLCWVTIFDLLKDKVTKIVLEDFEDKNKDLNLWFETICKDSVSETNTINFNKLSVAMAHSQHLSVMKASIDLSTKYVKEAFLYSNGNFVEAFRKLDHPNLSSETMNITLKEQTQS
jgi:hypothetical protein